jgi:hypothetical protein
MMMRGANGTKTRKLRCLVRPRKGRRRARDSELGRSGRLLRSLELAEILFDREIRWLRRPGMENAKGDSAERGKQVWRMTVRMRGSRQLEAGFQVAPGSDKLLAVAQACGRQAQI